MSAVKMTAEMGKLVDKLWQELDETVPRAHIQEVLDDVATRFQDATVTSFLTILIERKTREKLAEELRQTQVT